MDNGYEADIDEPYHNYELYLDHFTQRSFIVNDLISASRAFALSSVNQLNDTYYWFNKVKEFYMIEKMMDLNI